MVYCRLSKANQTVRRACAYETCDCFDLLFSACNELLGITGLLGRKKRSEKRSCDSTYIKASSEDSLPCVVQPATRAAETAKVENFVKSR